MDLNIRVFQTRDKKEYLNVLESCKRRDGITYINIYHQGGITRHKIWHSRQDTKSLQKVINRTKRMPMYLFK